MANNDYFNILNNVTIDNILIKDIFSRYDIQNLTENYIEYKIRDGDTPESIAEKFYGSKSLYWIIFLYNDIFDPFYDMPMTEDELRSYVLKYIDEHGETGETFNDYYTDLYDENESKRTIRILNPILISDIIRQFNDEVSKITT